MRNNYSSSISLVLVVTIMELCCAQGEDIKAASVRKKRLEQVEHPAEARFEKIHQVRGFVRSMPNTIIKEGDQFFLNNDKGQRKLVLVYDRQILDKESFYLGYFYDMTEFKKRFVYLKN